MRGCSVLFAAVCMAVATSSATAADWRRVGGNDQVDVYVDAMSIRPSGSFMKAWFMYNYGSTQPIANSYPPQNYRSYKELNFYNCGQGSSAISQQVMNSGTNGAGDVVKSIDLPIASLQFSDPAPDSIGEAELTVACAKRNP